jgi:hypothetical protein
MTTLRIKNDGWTTSKVTNYRSEISLHFSCSRGSSTLLGRHAGMSAGSYFGDRCPGTMDLMDGVPGCDSTTASWGCWGIGEEIHSLGLGRGSWGQWKWAITRPRAPSESQVSPNREEVQQKSNALKSVERPAKANTVAAEAFGAWSAPNARSRFLFITCTSKRTRLAVERNITLAS